MGASEAGGPRLPNVLVIGAQKCGTTALHALLAGHPEIFGSAQKELDFFSHNSGRERDLADYARSFEGAGDARVVLEASTSYSMFPLYSGTAPRIATALEGVKLIYVMRDPFERMRASYIGTVSTGKERRPIRLALLHGMDFYLYPSLYALQLEQYLEHIPLDRVLCLRQGDLLHDPGATLDRILEFLDLPVGWRPDTMTSRLNVSEGKRAPRQWWLHGMWLFERRPFRSLRRPMRTVLRTWSVASSPMPPERTVIPDDLRDAFLVLIRRDLVRLRELLGPGWDWGYLD